MKKLILTITTIALLASCNSSEKKVEDATENVIEANENLDDANISLDEANLKYQNELDKYKKQSYTKIDENNQSIIDFKSRIALEKKEAKADYQAKIDDLEKKNSDMKLKLDNYKMDNKEKWENFKEEFNHDMDELGAAFKDLTVKNTNTKK